MKLNTPPLAVTLPKNTVRSTTLLASFLITTFGASALADCVDFSEKRHKQAAAALAKNPPKFSELGLPEMSGLEIDAYKSSSDPKCDPPEKRSHFTYKTKASRLDFYKEIFPYMKPWKTWINPGGGDSHNFYLSSGTEIKLHCLNNKCKAEDYNSSGNITEISVTRRSNPPDSLSTDGPGWNWAPEDLAKGSGEPAAGRADKERPDSVASSGAANNSADQSKSSSTNSDNSTSNTVDDTLNKAKKLKDLLKF